MTETVRETKRADELVRHDWIGPGEAEESPVAVLAVAPFRSERWPRVRIVYRDSSGEPQDWDVAEDMVIALATAEQVERAQEREQRRQIVDELQEFADLIRTGQVPVPASLRIHVDRKSRTEVQEIGKNLGIEPDDRWNGALGVTWPRGRGVYEPGLYVDWQTDEKPVEPAVSAEGADGPAVPAEDATVLLRTAPTTEEREGWRDETTGLVSGGLVPNCPTCGGDHHTVEPCR